LYYRFTREANRQAWQMYEKAITLDPQYAKAYVWLGWTHAMDFAHNWSQEPQQSLERAMELGQQARALDDSLPHVHEILGWLYRWTNPQQAVAEAERAIALDPNYADSHFVLANVLCNLGRGEEAIGPVKKAMRLNPRYPAYYAWLLGFAYRLAGRVEEAIATLKHALTLNPNFQFTYIHLAWSYVWQWTWQLSQAPETLEHAFDAAQRAVDLNNLNHRAHARLGMVYVWRKQPQQAIAEAERAIALDPNDAEGHQLLADILSFVGRSEEAIAEAEQAIRLDSLNLWSLIELGHAYCLTGRYEEAIATLKSFLVHNPNILHAQLILAIAASEAGQAEDARAAAAEVLRINPKFSLETWKQRVSYTDSAIVERQLAALRKAGLE
jgi:tetratricopeptide (TPR) repeat protein